MPDSAIRIIPGSMADDVASGDDAPPAKAPSMLDGLAARRVAAIEALHIDLKVPRWDVDGAPAIWVRYAPLDTDKAANAYEKWRRPPVANAKRTTTGGRPDPEWRTKSTAEALVESCVGVFAVIDEDGEADVKVSLRRGDPHGHWTRFDPELADALGITAATAIEVCRGVYLTSGDMLAAFGELSEFSGTAAVQADEDFLAA